MAERRTPQFLTSLAPDEAMALAKISITREFEAGATLFREGDRSDHVVIVKTGRVKIAHLTVDRGEVVLAERGPGDILGELSAIDHRARSADAVALEPVAAMCITTDDFAQFLREQPGAAAVLLELMTSRLRHADRQAVEYGS